MKTARSRGASWAMVLALGLFWLAGCILEGNRTAKRGSEVENELGVYGVLVSEGGKPVPGAKVKAMPAAQAVLVMPGRAAVDTDSVVTDKDGRYSFRSLSTGRYNLLGDFQSGALVVLVPGVEYLDTTRGTFVGTDTLRAPGNIRGRLVGDGGAEGVLVYVPGSSYLAVSDDSGRFILSGLPQGQYSVRYSKTGYLAEPDTGVVVRSGATTDLPVRNLGVDPGLPPPEPRGVDAIYDSSRGMVRVTWRPVAVSDLQGYLVYRDEADLPEPKAIRLVSDTVFLDSTFPFSETARILTYRVRSRDRTATLSVNFSSPAQVIVPGDTTGIRTAWVQPLGDTVEAGEVVRLVISFDSPRDLRIEWRLAGTDTALRSSSLMDASGRDTLVWTAREGQADFTVVLTDGTGHVSRAARSFTVLPAVVDGAQAGRDRLVRAGEQVTLSGSTAPSFGSAARLEWRLGSVGGFRAVDGGDTTFVAPPGVDSLVWYFKATNNQGGSDSDTVVVSILRPRKIEWDSSPVIAAFPPRYDGRIVPFKGKLHLYGGQVGALVGERVDWQTGGDIWTSVDGFLWTQASPMAEFGARTYQILMAFQDKLWAIGRTPEFLFDVWNSEDGARFTRVSDSTAITGSPVSGFVFADKMWVTTQCGSSPINSYCLWSSTDGLSWTLNSNLPFVPYGLPAVAGGKVYFPSMDGLWSSSDATGWQRFPLVPDLPNLTLGYLASSGDTLNLLNGIYTPKLSDYNALGIWSIDASSEAQEFLSDDFPGDLSSVWSAVRIGGRLLIYTADDLRDPARYETRIWTTRP